MKRKAYKEFLRWKKEDARECALFVDGARRIGKSYLIEEFAKNEYETYILIDFNIAGDEVRNLFEVYLSDLDSFFMMLSAIYNTKLIEHKSLIIFDEVQLFPRARAAIKYLVKDNRYDYIETGSLVSIKKNVKDIQIPSEERHMKMNPMDFEEFLWAMGDEVTIPLLKKMFLERKPLGALYRKINLLFRQYLIVGGMPKAVLTYVETKDFEKVDRIKRDILTLYRNDIQKYAGKDVEKVSAIFDEIPSQLQRHDRAFKLSDLEKEARFRGFEEAFFWLKDSGVMTPCYNTTEPSVGLKMNKERTTMKCFMADTGLLISHTFDENGIMSEEIYKKLLLDKLSVNFGNLMENIVAQMLTASGHSLYFYTNSSREDAQSRMEIDFLVSKTTVTNKHNISPLEIKTGKNYTVSSIKKFMKKYPDQLNEAFVFHEGEIKCEDGITYLPLFMVGCL